MPQAAATSASSPTYAHGIRRDSRTRSNQVVWERLLLCIAALFLASHWIHLSADPPVKLGWFGSVNHSNDFFTDEGFHSNNVIWALLRGHWYLPGEFNEIVEAPLWPLILFLPFKVFGVSIVVARVITTTLYFSSVGMVYLFVKRWSNGVLGAVTAVILASNFVAMVYSRLAVQEAVWVFFAVAALLTAQRTGRTRALWLSFAAGLLVGLAVLTKMTASFVIVPVLGVLWFESDRWKVFGRRALAAVAGCLVLVLPYRLLIVPQFAADNQEFLSIDIASRRITHFSTWVQQWFHMAVGANAIDRTLYVTCGLALVGVAALLILKRQRLAGIHPLVWISIAWILLNLTALSIVSYFPIRYSFSLIVPIAILAVICSQTIFQAWKPAGLLLYGMLACSCILNMAESAAYEVRPVYSYQNMASSIKRHIEADGVAHPQIMGKIAATLALSTNISSLQDGYGTIPQADQIERFQPTYFISQEPAIDSVTASFAEAHRQLVLEDRYDVFGDYMTHSPVYFYRVETEPVR